MPAIDISEFLCLHYEEVNPGGAPPVLLLHGLGSVGADWRFQFDALAGAGYRVLAPDLRGFGRSSAPPEVTVPAMAGDMVHLLARLGAVPAHVVGLSMGGVVALQLAIDHPEVVRRLVLVNTFARLRPQSLSGWFYWLLRAVLTRFIGPEKQAAMVAQRVFPRPEHEEMRRNLYQHIIHTNPCAYRSAMQALRRFDVRSRLGELQMPVLVVTGSEDTTVSPPVQKEMAQHIPGARHVIVEGSGHGVIADNPDAFNRILLQFLEE